MATKNSEEWLKARVEKAKEALALQAVNQEALPAQLPLWPDSVRAVPNALLRGALFSISNVREVVKKRTLLASVKGIEVRFKGERLNQTDLDTWETIIHLARSQNLGSKVQFSAHSMLTMLGRHHGREQHEQLKEDISRLTGAVVEITIKETAQAFGGALVQSYYRDEVEQAYVIEVSPQLLKLYQAGNTYIDLERAPATGQCQPGQVAARLLQQPRRSTAIQGGHDPGLVRFQGHAAAGRLQKAAAHSPGSAGDQRNFDYWMAHRQKRLCGRDTASFQQPAQPSGRSMNRHGILLPIKIPAIALIAV